MFLSPRSAGPLRPQLPPSQPTNTPCPRWTPKLGTQSIFTFEHPEVSTERPVRLLRKPSGALRSYSSHRRLAKRMNRSLHSPERSAIALRSLLDLSDTQCLDPFALARHLDYRVLTLNDIPNLPVWARRHLEDRADLWSGAAITVRGRTIILLNSRHTKERMHATLMEELSHLWLGHTPSVIRPDSSELNARTYDEDQESEAYATGAAALVPHTGLRQLVLTGKSIPSIARQYGVSRELIQYRLKVTRLWKTLQRKRQIQHEMFQLDTPGSLRVVPP